MNRKGDGKVESMRQKTDRNIQETKKGRGLRIDCA